MWLLVTPAIIDTRYNRFPQSRPVPWLTKGSHNGRQAKGAGGSRQMPSVVQQISMTHPCRLSPNR